MSETTIAAVRAAALSLPVEERAQLANELWDSLPHPPETSPEDLAALLASRIAEIDAGKAVMVPSEEAHRLIWEDGE